MMARFWWVWHHNKPIFIVYLTHSVALEMKQAFGSR